MNFSFQLLHFLLACIKFRQTLYHLRHSANFLKYRFFTF
jgi:hypothetical protein